MSVFAGTYADLKFVRSRKVAQVVIEMPIEEATRFLAAFGAPDPSAETWVAIAGLDYRYASKDRFSDAGKKVEDDAESEKPRRQRDDLRPSARAAMLCNETVFQAFLKVQNAEQAAEKVRRHCGIESRRELDADETKLMMFRAIESRFEEWRKERRL